MSERLTDKQAALLLNLCRACYDLGPDECEAIAAALARIDALEAENRLLARLAADTPQFYNPLEAMAAKTLRDQILAQGATE